jgi:hypothetical protein
LIHLKKKSLNLLQQMQRLLRVERRTSQLRLRKRGVQRRKKRLLSKRRRRRRKKNRKN